MGDESSPWDTGTGRLPEPHQRKCKDYFNTAVPKLATFQFNKSGIRYLVFICPEQCKAVANEIN